MRTNFLLVLAIVFMMLLVLACDAFAWIHLDALAQVESSGNLKAFNETSKARGLFQITPICLKDFNQLTKNNFQSNDLFNEKINTRIAKWYLFTRIPQLLKAKSRINKPTDEQILTFFGGYKTEIDAVGYIKKYRQAYFKNTTKD